ncbi:spaetzle-like protein, partial [Asbolus verrucosus]
VLILYATSVQSTETSDSSSDEPPEGYYVFVESPNAEPPRVRPPPYSHAPVDCREDENKSPHVSPFNLCGDLNKGTIPRNPMGQNVLGSPYPFELIRNMTLKYLSRTLPILKADETLPKVAQLQDDLVLQNTITPFQNNDRVKRDTETKKEEKQTEEKNDTVGKKNERQGRKFCDQGGILCMLYKAINGEPYSSPTLSQPSSHLPVERRDEISQPRYEGPPTPCPAKVEYATPVFAKNYQGVWRYVVQIPYEGYFTQTVEVTRCLQSRCHYLDGGCLSSPRWSSLLVAEIYYPDTVLSNSDAANPQRSPVAASQPPSVQDFQNYQQYLHKRAGLQAAPADSSTTSRPTHCDGVDALGCFQVRLYYDWFLIPGSCKCWRPDYFNKYVRRKSSSSDL